MKDQTHDFISLCETLRIALMCSKYSKPSRVIINLIGGTYKVLRPESITLRNIYISSKLDNLEIFQPKNKNKIKIHRLVSQYILLLLLLLLIKIKILWIYMQLTNFRKVVLKESAFYSPLKMSIDIGLLKWESPQNQLVASEDLLLNEDVVLLLWNTSYTTLLRR